jgi:ubiquinone/menaquinone biosynthesis C-methylase UbiE
MTPELMVEDQALSLFFEIHDDIPRGGPGGLKSTRRAFQMLTDLPKQPILLDVGCGPGMQTLDLAGLTEGRIIAVDSHQPFLNRLHKAIEQDGPAGQITVMKGDMCALPFTPGAFDVIWAEGSIYIMGFEKALRAWKPLLKKGGYLAATEVTWLRPDPPEELRSFWAEEYPAIQDIEANLASLRRSGYRPAGHFTLPESDWWDHYYSPIQEKLKSLWTKYKNTPEAHPVLQMEEREIDLYGRYSDYYGYVFYVGQVAC